VSCGATVPLVDVDLLLDELCARLGFCLDPEPRNQLLAALPNTVDGLTDAVIRAEGLDPLTYDAAIRKQVAEVVARHMGVALWDPEGRRQRGRRR
jgi:hypothetical protein